MHKNVLSTTNIEGDKDFTTFPKYFPLYLQHFATEQIQEKLPTRWEYNNKATSQTIKKFLQIFKQFR